MWSRIQQYYTLYERNNSVSILYSRCTFVRTSTSTLYEVQVDILLLYECFVHTEYVHMSLPSVSANFAMMRSKCFVVTCVTFYFVVFVGFCFCFLLFCVSLHFIFHAPGGPTYSNNQTPGVVYTSNPPFALGKSRNCTGTKNRAGCTFALLLCRTGSAVCILMDH